MHGDRPHGWYRGAIQRPWGDARVSPPPPSCLSPIRSRLSYYLPQRLDGAVPAPPFVLILEVVHLTHALQFLFVVTPLPDRFGSCASGCRRLGLSRLSCDRLRHLPIP